MPSHFIAIPFGFLLRVIQVVVDSSHYLVIGFLTAGVLRAMAGPERLRALFGTAPLRAWAAATTLLPVCSLGVLPVLRVLRRAGVTRPAVLTFALAAPMLNPISLIYGMSYLGPNALGVLILGTAMVSIGVGVLWGYLHQQDLTPEIPPSEGRVPSVGLRRLAAAFVHAARESVGPPSLDIALGVLGAGLAASLIAAPSLASTMFAGDATAIPRMMAVAPASYLTPDQAVVIVPEMLKFRQSAGAMFALISLGAGMTLGHLSWISRGHGTRSAALWLALTAVLTLAVACGVDALIPPVGTANEDNDHFNIIANPLENSESLSDARHGLVRYFQGLGGFRLVTCGALASLVVGGLVLRRLGERGCFEAFLVEEAPPSSSEAGSRGDSRCNRPLSPRVLSRLASVVLLLVAIAGAYAYFPSPSDAFRDMKIIKADFYGELGASTTDAPLHHLALWDRQAAKLETGAMIRLAMPNDAARRATRELRDGIQSLRAAVEQHRPDEARAVFGRVQKSFSMCQAAYGVDDDK